MSDDMLGRLNSATKYPSIPTYHELNRADGKLIDEVCQLFEGPVTLTEKIDGTNGRVVVLPDGDWFIGSREELLYARGDRVENPNLGIVPALLPLAPSLAPSGHMIRVYYLEVYGYRIGPAAKQYTRDAQAVGYRLFDVAQADPGVLGTVRSEIAAWREHGGQLFADEGQLESVSAAHAGLPLVPRLGTVDAADLPTSLTGMQEFLRAHLPDGTEAALDGTAGRQPEGIVLRSRDRKAIAKARFSDYAHALAPAPVKRVRERA